MDRSGGFRKHGGLNLRRLPLAATEFTANTSAGPRLEGTRATKQRSWCWYATNLRALLNACPRNPGLEGGRRNTLMGRSHSPDKILMAM